MPGGILHIALDEELFAVMTGPVDKIAEGVLSSETER